MRLVKLFGLVTYLLDNISIENDKQTLKYTKFPTSLCGFKPHCLPTSLHRPMRLIKLFGLVTYLDWIMIMVTIMSCCSMFFETPHIRMTNTPSLQVGFSFWQ